MNQSTAFEFDKEERDLLLLGLRHVRSSIAMEVQDPTEENVRLRRDRIRDVEELISRLSGAPTESTANV